MLGYNEQADDYEKFIESLEDANGDAEGKNSGTAASGNKEKYEDEVRVGIKDWLVMLQLIFLLLAMKRKAPNNYSEPNPSALRDRAFICTLSEWD